VQFPPGPKPANPSLDFQRTEIFLEFVLDARFIKNSGIVAGLSVNS
jgi:hypothetical protein